MDIQTTPITGTDLAATLVVHKASLGRSLKRALNRIEDEDVNELVPLSRAAARAKFKPAWDAPPWRVGDLERLRWVRSHARRQTWSGVAALRATDWMSGDGVAAIAGYDGGKGWKSALPHLSGYCLQVSRRPLWDVERRDGVIGYYLTDEVKELFGRLD